VDRGAAAGVSKTGPGIRSWRGGGGGGRESAAVPSGIMRREQWQLLPIHVGGVGGGCSGVGYDSPPRVSHQKSAGG